MVNIKHNLTLKKLRTKPTYTNLFLRTRMKKRILETYERKMPTRVKRSIKKNTSPKVYQKIVSTLSNGQVPRELKQVILTRFDKHYLKEFERTYWKDQKAALKKLESWYEF